MASASPGAAGEGARRSSHAATEPPGAPSAPSQAAASAAPTATAAGTAEDDPEIASADLELLLQQAQAALASVDAPVEEHLPGLSQYQFEEFTGAAASRDSATLDLLRDVDLDLRIELGRTNMYLEEVLKLRKGAVVPLDKLAGDPVDIYVNGRLIARGEVLVLNDNFCVRIAELVASDQPATA
jgi:flagellar motor switch protein FliN/FliY